MRTPVMKAGFMTPAGSEAFAVAGPWLVALVATIGLLLLFADTSASALQQWESSSAYNYGYLIAPVSLYLLWLDRAILRIIPARPSLTGLAIVVAFSIVWLAADLLGIDQGRHLALVGMMQGLILAVLGMTIYRRGIFAFNYLWLMVPAGDFLIRPLQEIAHTGSVVLLRLSGIPVYAEGLIVEVPQGVFVVEPGCAGLNFFLAALALSLIYGKVMYDRLSARIACVIAALTVSVLANIVRIYLIIALTEWTAQRIGLADDHLLFGWGFFAVIMLALMWFGARWTGSLAQSPAPHSARPSPGARWCAAAGAACLALAAFAPLLSNISAAAPTASLVPFILPREVGAWHLQPAVSSPWRPAIVPGDGTLQAMYVSDIAVPVALSVTYYDAQSDGREAAAAGNGPGESGRWTLVRTDAVKLTDVDMTVAASTLEAGGRIRRVLHWYDAGGCVTASRLRAKLCTARERLLRHASAGAFVALSAEGEGGQVDAFLADFAKQLPAFSGPTLLTDERG